MLKLRSNIMLKLLNTEHASKMFDWVRKPSVSQNIGLRYDPTLEKTIDWIKKAQESKEIYPFAIYVDETYVGNAILDKVDLYLSTARFSIYIGEPDLKSSGVGKTATYKICQFGFEDLNLNKIWLTVHSKNFRAINAYSQIEFKLEGILRQEFILENEKIDVIYMGLLKQDFNNLTATFKIAL